MAASDFRTHTGTDEERIHWIIEKSRYHEAAELAVCLGGFDQSLESDIPSKV